MPHGLRFNRPKIQLEIHHVFMSQKLKKLKEEESWPFGPSCAANSGIYSSILHAFHLLMRQNQPYKKNHKVFVFRANHLAVGSMVIRVVEFLTANIVESGPTLSKSQI